jgi:hypothetical protein
MSKKGIKRDSEKKGENISKGIGSKERGKIKGDIAKYLIENAGEFGNKLLSENIEEKFGIRISADSIKNYKRKNGIKGIRSKKLIVKTEKNIFTKEVIEFMRKCAKEGITSKDACAKCELEFGHSFSLNSFRSVAGLNKMGFRKFPLNDISLINPKVVELIKKNKDKDLLEIRDEIIEKLEINLTIKEINKVLDNFYPEREKEVKRGRKEGSHYKSPEELEKTKQKYLGNIHLDINGKYACNPSITANKDKLTKDKSKVTCSNCKREMEDLYKNEDEEEDNDLGSSNDLEEEPEQDFLGEDE